MHAGFYNLVDLETLARTLKSKNRRILADNFPEEFVFAGHQFIGFSKE